MRRSLGAAVAAGVLSLFGLVLPASALGGDGIALPKPTVDYVEAAKSRVLAAAKVNKLPSVVQPSLQSLMSSTGYRQIGYVTGLTCSPYSKPSLATSPEPCWFGDPSATRTLILYGDSHAGSWIPAMDLYAKSIKVKLAVFWFPGCPSPLVTASTSGSFYSSRATECNQWNARITSAMAAVNPFAIVMSSGYGIDHAFSSNEYQQWLNGWTLLANQLRTKAPRAALYMLTTTPYLRQSAPQCLANQPNAITNCGYSSSAFSQSGYTFSLADNKIRDVASARAAGATLVDVVPLFCANLFCPAVIGTSVVYGDSHHLTTQINLDLAPALGQLLNGSGLK